MKQIRARANFPASVRDAIARCAGFKCSFPDCDLGTTGPGGHNTGPATIGIAAHIFSAVEGGPRGSGGLSFAQRQELDNAIWLCPNHAAIIDKNDGHDYSASTLREYRLIRQRATIRERDGTGGKIAWIHKLSLDQVPIFQTPTAVEFGKITVIQGSNDSGKTALCDWIQGVSDSGSLDKWADSVESKTLSFEVTCLTPSSEKIRVRVRSRDEIEYFVNGEPQPFNTSPVRFVRLRDLRTSPFGGHIPPMTDLEFLSKTLAVSPAVVRNMLPYVGVQGTSSVKKLRLQTEFDGTIRVWAELENTISGLSLQTRLSNSERSRVLIEIAAVFARHSAKRVPTVLLLDWAAKSFDANWMNRMITFLSDKNNPFQTVIERVNHGPTTYVGARVVSLRGRERGVMIEE